MQNFVSPYKSYLEAVLVNKGRTNKNYFQVSLRILFCTSFENLFLFENIAKVF